MMLAVAVWAGLFADSPVFAVSLTTIAVIMLVIDIPVRRKGNLAGPGDALRGFPPGKPGGRDGTHTAREGTPRAEPDRELGPATAEELKHHLLAGRITAAADLAQTELGMEPRSWAEKNVGNWARLLADGDGGGDVDVRVSTNGDGHATCGVSPTSDRRLRFNREQSRELTRLLENGQDQEATRRVQEWWGLSNWAAAQLIVAKVGKAMRDNGHRGEDHGDG